MFYCRICKEESPIWERICPVCSAEDSMEKMLLLSEAPNNVSKIHEQEHLLSGFPFFDAVFKGFLRTFVYFLTAERGAGKTTFLLQVCASLISIGRKVLFFSFDEGEVGIMKKCSQYGLNSDLFHFVFEKNPGIVERLINQSQPDFVVLDSLQSYVQYNNDALVSTLHRFRKEAQMQRFAAVVIGEQWKDGSDYLGSASIGYIVDVQMKLENTNNVVILSTPQKNRDTDDRTSRAFFKRTPSGLVEIRESETGYLLRHSEKAKVGLASFVAREGNVFFVDEITSVFVDTDSKKPSLTIAGMNSAKAKSLLALLLTNFTLGSIDIFLRANKSERLQSDAELACLIAVISRLNKTAVSVDSVFIESIDNGGYLLPVDDMEQRIKRAKAFEYNRIFGPKAIGSQNANWEQFETLESLNKELFQ